MPKNSNTNYGLTVSLTDAEANAITMAQPAGNTATDKLSLTASGLLRDLSKGGCMIAPEWAARIEAAIQTTDPAAIVDHVERSVGREGEATRVEWIVDPTQIAFYQSLADNAGITLNHQLKSILDWSFEQGWLGMSAPDPFKLLLTSEQWRKLQQLLGKDIPTGQDVMELLGSQPEPLRFEDDLVFDSVKD